MARRGWIASVALIVAACGGGAGGQVEGPTVVATTTILGDIVSNVVGDGARVVVLTPLGADPHDFQASAAQVAGINQADLVVANGLGLEEGLTDVLAAAARDGVRVLEIAPLVEPIPFTTSHDHDAGLDPHVWFDPLRVAEAARGIATVLAEVVPSDDWRAGAEAYAADLAAADQRIGDLLEAVPASDRRLVTNHDSLGYFADRYGFEIIGTVIPAGSTMAEPSSMELATLVGVMREAGLTVIFAETTQPGDLAEAVAAELGEDVEVVSLATGSLGEPGSETGTLIRLLEANAAAIAEALGG